MSLKEYVIKLQSLKSTTVGKDLNETVFTEIWSVRIAALNETHRVILPVLSG
jgi:hypothetical protein